MEATRKQRKMGKEFQDEAYSRNIGTQRFESGVQLETHETQRSDPIKIHQAFKAIASDRCFKVVKKNWWYQRRFGCNIECIKAAFFTGQHSVAAGILADKGDEKVLGWASQKKREAKHGNSERVVEEKSEKLHAARVPVLMRAIPHWAFALPTTIAHRVLSPPLSYVILDALHSRLGFAAFRALLHSASMRSCSAGGMPGYVDQLDGIYIGLLGRSLT
ncbi:hypothetical protein B0H19DRAFT_1239810 [Mycena capillaripes]|nr:hypothetical protein B0H19DRAFT_1239810 [Mycena capillaripes]